MILYFSSPIFRVHLIVGAKVTSHLSRWQGISRHLSTTLALLPLSAAIVNTPVGIICPYPPSLFMP